MLRLGASKTLITPLRPIPLAGFAHRRGPYERVRRELHCRVLCFESTRSEGSPGRALLVSADILWWGSDRVGALKRRLSEVCATAEEAIVLHATHNHSGPQTSDRFIPALGRVCPEYVDQLEGAVIEAAREAVQELSPVVAARGSGVCDIGVNRRKWLDGRIEMAPNPQGASDQECVVVRLQTPTGRTKALLTHFACHPTTTDRNEVSSEFPGAAMDALEADEDDGMVAWFGQGCCGTIRPALIRDDRFYRGDDDDVAGLAERLVSSVHGILRAPMAPCRPAPVEAIGSVTPLDHQTAPSEQVLSVMRDMPGMQGEWARLLLRSADRRSGPTTLEITRIAVADNLRFVSFNAEMSPAYGLYLKRLTGGRSLPLAYSNGMIGYVTTAAELEEGGYEPRESTLCFGLPSPFAAETEARILEKVREGEHSCEGE